MVANSDLENASPLLTILTCHLHTSYTYLIIIADSFDLVGVTTTSYRSSGNVPSSDLLYHVLQRAVVEDDWS